MPLVYIRSDVSAAAETHSQNYTRMYSFDDATTQMRRIFQKVGLVGFIMRKNNREQFYILCFCRFDNPILGN